MRLRHGGTPTHYRVVPALGAPIGLLVSWRGITGRLARENSIRQPGRTLVTALALTVGLALVAFISVLAAGTKATINQAVSRSFAGNLIVENSQGSQQGIPPAVAPAVARVPGVASVTPIAFTIGRVRDLSNRGRADRRKILDHRDRTGLLREGLPDRMGTGLKRRRCSRSDSTGTVLTKSFASAHHLKVGQQAVGADALDQHVPLTVVGIAKDNARLLADLTINRALAQQRLRPARRRRRLRLLRPGRRRRTRCSLPSIALLASQFPQARSRTAAQFKKNQAGKINQLLLLIYVLLALSVIVSLFGIVNTLILSIYERTRELGMMRAIGTSRRQVRQMIRYESIITALIGGVFGLVIGTVGAVLVTTLRAVRLGLRALDPRRHADPAARGLGARRADRRPAARAPRGAPGRAAGACASSE